jgi:hypothetical protein
MMDRGMAERIFLIILGVFAVAAMFWFRADNDKAIRDSESCYTDHPNNVVMCVDTGMGHHNLMPPKPPEQK